MKMNAVLSTDVEIGAFFVFYFPLLDCHSALNQRPINCLTYIYALFLEHGLFHSGTQVYPLKDSVHTGKPEQTFNLLKPNIPGLKKNV